MSVDVDASLQSISRESRPEIRVSRLRDLAARAPRDPAVWLQLAQTAVRARQFEIGLDALDHALCLDLQSAAEVTLGLPTFMAQRIQALKYATEIARAGDHQAELVALRRLVARFPDHAPLLFNYAVQLFAEDPGEAVRVARRAVAQSPGIASLLPERLRTALAAAPARATEDPIVGTVIGNYRVLGVRTQSPEHVLYDGVRVSDCVPVTLRRHVKRTPESAQRLFLDQKNAPPIHPSIVPALDAVTGPDGTPLQVLERINARTVWDAFARTPDDRRDHDRDLDRGLDVAWLTARVVADLHERNALHGAIGPECVLVDDGNIAKPILIIDDGLELRRRSGGSLPVGNAPDGEATTAGDIYGLGILLHYVMTGELPRGHHVNLALLPSDAAGTSVRDVLQRCLDPNPRKRSRAKELTAKLESLWFKHPAQLDVGDIIDDWRLDTRLGEGTFADVFRASHVLQPARTAAVKVLRSVHAVNREARYRFEREATRTPVHPGIVRIEPRIFYLASIAPYFAMELLSGCSLRAVVADPQPLGTVVAWGIDLADALAFAHDSGMVHRDIKPENAFVLDPDRAGVRHVKLLDFGIAKVADAGLLTANYTAMGTLEYMAPEQFDGPDVDPRADVYGLGVMLLECALGAHPAPPPGGDGLEPFARWKTYHKQHEVVTPVVRARFAASEAGAAFCDLIQRMTAKPRGERPAMADVRSELASLAEALANPVPADRAATDVVVRPSGDELDRPHPSVPAESMPMARVQDPAGAPGRPREAPAVPGSASTSPQDRRGITRAMVAGAASVAVLGLVTVLATRHTPPGKPSPPGRGSEGATAVTPAPPAIADGCARLATEHYDLVLAGSNTIGGVDEDSQKGLATELVYAFLKATWPGGTQLPDQLCDATNHEEKDRIITYRLADGTAKRVLIQPHGSSTVAAAVTTGTPRADIGMSSTPRHDLPGGFREFVIALDAVAVVVHPSNPRDEITLAELSTIFGPDPAETEWSGRPGHPIKTYGRDRKSGTTEVFRAMTGIDAAMRQRHLDPKRDIPYTGIPGERDEGHFGFENTNAVVDRVSRDLDGIGYVGRAANRFPGVKTLAIRATDRSSAFRPNPQTIRTMEYAMARELYFYRAGVDDSRSALAKQFTAFCVEEGPGKGQEVADAAGFVGFSAARILDQARFGDHAPKRLKDAVGDADRISFSFRFNFNETSLDTVGEQNLAHLRKFLDPQSKPDLARRALIVVAHSDSIGTPAEKLATSRTRATNFVKRLVDEGFDIAITPLWFGSDYLIADDRGDPDSAGAQRNRRIDLFLVKPK